MIGDDSKRGLWNVLTAAFFGISATSLVVATSSDYGFAIDEATYIWVARETRAWFSELPNRDFEKSFSRDALAERWHYLESPFDRPTNRHSNFNLPAAMHVMNLGWLIGHRFLDELHADRLGSAILFGVAVAASVSVLGRRRGWICGVVTGVFLIANPRLFGHAHFAATETPLTCFWLLTCMTLILATEPSTRTWSSAALFGLCVGLLFATKITGWLIAVPVAIWLLTHRPSGWIRLAACAIIGAIAVTYLLTPPLWREPIAGVVRLVKLSANNPWKIPSVYFGQAYGSDMPWHSGFVIFAMTIPLATLLLGSIGIIRSRRDPIARLFTLNAAMLLAARTFGLMPMHDVDRQFAPLYAMWAVLAALGCESIVALLVRRSGTSSTSVSAFGGVIATMVVTACLVEPTLETWRYRQRGLSYYNRAIGGLSGADRAGMEVSYWFEAATNDVWRDFLAHVPKGSKLFLRPDHPGLDYLTERGIWRADLKSVGPEEADFFLFYARKAAYAVPDGNNASFIMTDLLSMQQNAPAIAEVRFDGVRLLGLFDRRR